MTVPADATLSSSGTTFTGVVRRVLLTLAAGAVSGFLVGGVGGRVAMRVLALTSPDIAQGRLTDDAARVGAFSLGGSLALALALSMVGAVVGMSYLVVRRVLPQSRRGRMAGYALFTGVVGGAALVHDHPSFDYTILQPTWLAVALFILIPTVYGAMVAWIVESWPEADRAPAGGPLAAIWRSRSITALGTVLYWAVVCWGSYAITADIVSLATDHPSQAPFSL